MIIREASSQVRIQVTWSRRSPLRIQESDITSRFAKLQYIWWLQPWGYTTTLKSDLQTEISFTFIQSRSYIISSWEVETTHRVAALESAASEKSQIGEVRCTCELHLCRPKAKSSRTSSCLTGSSWIWCPTHLEEQIPHLSWQPSVAGHLTDLWTSITSDNRIRQSCHCRLYFVMEAWESGADKLRLVS